MEISTYRGGLNGDGYEAKVRKFGDDWVVVSLTMAYVSLSWPSLPTTAVSQSSILQSRPDPDTCRG